MKKVMLLLLVCSCTSKLESQKLDLITKKYLEIEKNNFINDFLSNSDDELYILDLLKTKVDIKKTENEYSFVSSLEIGDIDKQYVLQFVNRIKPFLIKHSIKDLTFDLSLPVNNNSMPKPPPPPPVFYGNFGDGKIPEHIPNPYD